MPLLIDVAAERYREFLLHDGILLAVQQAGVDRISLRRILRQLARLDGKLELRIFIGVVEVGDHLIVEDFDFVLE